MPANVAVGDGVISHLKRGIFRGFDREVLLSLATKVPKSAI